MEEWRRNYSSNPHQVAPSPSILLMHIANFVAFIFVNKDDEMCIDSVNVYISNLQSL
jgi:hypothetical protein